MAVFSRKDSKMLTVKVKQIVIFKTQAILCLEEGLVRVVAGYAARIDSTTVGKILHRNVSNLAIFF